MMVVRCPLQTNRGRRGMIIQPLSAGIKPTEQNKNHFKPAIAQSVARESQPAASGRRPDTRFYSGIFLNTMW
jgi:hypothetical protein